MTEGYRRVLAASLAKRWIVMVAFAIVASACFFLLQVAEVRAGPGRGPRRYPRRLRRPRGATLEYSDKYARQLEGIYGGTRMSSATSSSPGNPTVNQGISFVGPDRLEGRTRNSLAVVRNCSRGSCRHSRRAGFPVTPPSLGQSPRERPINFVIVTSASYAELRNDREDPRRSGEEPGHHQRRHRPQAQQAGAFGEAQPRDLPTSACRSIRHQSRRTLETMLGGRQVTRFKRDGEQYDVIVQVGRPIARGRTTSATSTCAARTTPADPARQPDRRRRNRGAARTQPLRPAPRGGDHRQPGPGCRWARR